MPEAPVLELLNAVSIAKRMANMALHSDGFGTKQENNKKKNERAGMGGKNPTTKGNVWKNKPVREGAGGAGVKVGGAQKSEASGAGKEREKKRVKV